jgi:hypothetical protein
MMKRTLLSTLLISLGMASPTHAATYKSNDGVSAPGTFKSKTNSNIKTASPVTSETGVRNSSGVTTEEMNTSPNPAPTTDREVIDNATLSNERFRDVGPFSPGAEVQAQEEDAMDYSTTPQKRVPSKEKKKK